MDVNLSKLCSSTSRRRKPCDNAQGEGVAIQSLNVKPNDFKSSAVMGPGPTWRIENQRPAVAVGPLSGRQQGFVSAGMPRDLPWCEKGRGEESGPGRGHRRQCSHSGKWRYTAKRNRHRSTPSEQVLGFGYEPMASCLGAPLSSARSRSATWRSAMHNTAPFELNSLQCEKLHETF